MPLYAIWNSREIDDIWYSIEVVEREQNHIYQYSRRENIEISGLPENIPQEILETVCINLPRKIGVGCLQSWEITVCHRLKKVEGQATRNVIIRFLNRKRVIQCLQNRKYIKNCTTEYPGIYIFENLCPRFKSIMEDCKKLKIDGDIKKIWTFNGIINFRKTINENEWPKKIFHVEDLNKYLPE